MFNLKLAKAVSVALAAAATTCAVSGVVRADDAQSTQALQDQMRVMRQQMDAMQKQMDAMKAKPPAAAGGAAAGGSAAAQGPMAQGPGVAKDKAAKDKDAPSTEPKFDKFLKGFYGTLDVSVDYSTKGMSELGAYHYGLINPADPNAGSFRDTAAGLKSGPQGKVGWLADLSTNKSVVGYRGSHKITGTPVEFIYQLEVQPQITNTPGSSAGYVAQSSTVKGALGYGDSFVGISNNDWGKLKFGTTYSPYKKSTDRMNPFSGMLGDYAVIMGNSGGDNRVEFGTRLEHSAWYESPKFGGVFSFDFLFSPNQNRSTQNIAQSAGSSDCSGGNIPGSGNLPLGC
ncbi:MAG: porin, partial [Pseudomonadota bacterium]|nr:porin [Pseudomonadota bacterium]